MTPTGPARPTDPAGPDDRVTTSEQEGGVSGTPSAPGPDEAYAAALASLPGMGPVSLAALLRDRAPQEVWVDVRRGRIRAAPGGRAAGRRRPEKPGPGRIPRDPALEPFPVGFPTSSGGADLPGDPGPWTATARRLDPETWWAGPALRGVRVTWPGADSYPAAFVADPQPPGVLFWRGSLEWLTHPCVAVVGTRRATPEGRSVAFELGRDLARSGVCVVSGLALGIDGAAHTGALQGRGGGDFAGPVGLAASGVDVPYPRRHRELWEAVATEGAVLSETLPGCPAEAWRFPLRNRLIAGLVRLVVVVESDTAGGSLHTVEAALARGVEVRAVPGPVRSRASAGTNQLLYEGAGVVRDAQDALDALGMVRPADCGPDRSRLDAATGPVLEAVGWTATSLEQVVGRSGRSVAEARGALAALAAAGLVRRDSGWWVRTGGVAGPHG